MHGFLAAPPARLGVSREAVWRRRAGGGHHAVDAAVAAVEHPRGEALVQLHVLDVEHDLAHGLPFLLSFFDVALPGHEGHRDRSLRTPRERRSRHTSLEWRVQTNTTARTAFASEVGHAGHGWGGVWHGRAGVRLQHAVESAVRDVLDVLVVLEKLLVLVGVHPRVGLLVETCDRGVLLDELGELAFQLAARGPSASALSQRHNPTVPNPHSSMEAFPGEWFRLGAPRGGSGPRTSSAWLRSRSSSSSSDGVSSTC